MASRPTQGSSSRPTLQLKQTTSKMLPEQKNVQGREEILANVFDTDQKPSIGRTAKSTATPSAADFDIRQEPAVVRFAFQKGERLLVYIGEEVVAEITKPLLQATSTIMGGIFKDGAVHLPQDTEKDGVVRLLDYLAYATRTSKNVALMRKAMSTHAALSVCAAAKVLGMEMYVDHIYRVMDAHFHQDIPTYEDIDAVLAFKKQHMRLYKVVAEYLAVLVWEEEIPDPEFFEQYLSKNPELRNAINDANAVYQKTLLAEQKRIHQEEYDQQKAAAEEKYKQRVKAKWVAKNEKSVEMEKIFREKSSGPLENRKKFDANERHWWVKTRGCPPPKGC